VSRLKTCLRSLRTHFNFELSTVNKSLTLFLFYFHFSNIVKSNLRHIRKRSQALELSSNSGSSVVVLDSDSEDEGSDVGDGLPLETLGTEVVRQPEYAVC
jgi:hypothetical protein